MFPHACGDELERAIAAGADPKAVVPDEYGNETVSVAASIATFAGAPSDSSASNGVAPSSWPKLTT